MEFYDMCTNKQKKKKSATRENSTWPQKIENRRERNAQK